MSLGQVLLASLILFWATPAHSANVAPWFDSKIVGETTGAYIGNNGDRLKVESNGSTVSVTSGTVTANQGLPTVNPSAWPVKITDAVDGTVMVTPSPAPTNAVGLVVRNIPQGTQTVSGNVSITSLPAAAVQAWSNNLRYLEMDADHGGVARGTTVTNSAWTTIYSYTGTGYVGGFIINLETFLDWRVRFIVDGFEVFDTSSGFLSDDMTGDTIFDLDDAANVSQAAIGLSKGSHDRVVFSAPLEIPIRFNSSVSIQLKRETGKASKKFQAGMIALSRES